MSSSSASFVVVVIFVGCVGNKADFFLNWVKIGKINQFRNSIICHSRFFTEINEKNDIRLRTLKHHASPWKLV